MSTINNIVPPQHDCWNRGTKKIEIKNHQAKAWLADDGDLAEGIRIREIIGKQLLGIIEKDRENIFHRGNKILGLSLFSNRV